MEVRREEVSGENNSVSQTEEHRKKLLNKDRQLMLANKRISGLIDILNVQCEFIRQKDEQLRQKDEQIDHLERVISNVKRQKDEQIDHLERVISNIKSTMAYQLYAAIVKPLLKKIRKSEK